MEKNSFFEHMRDTATAHNEAKSTRIREREALLDAGDWDGVDAWNEREKAFPNPFTQGETLALIAYDRSLTRGVDGFEVDDLPFADDLDGFVETIRKAGVQRIVVTDESTALMSGIHALAALGCRIQGLTAITRSNDHGLAGKEPVRKNGIEFAIA